MLNKVELEAEVIKKPERLKARTGKTYVTGLVKTVTNHSLKKVEAKHKIVAFGLNADYLAVCAVGDMLQIDGYLNSYVRHGLVDVSVVVEKVQTQTKGDE